MSVCSTHNLTDAYYIMHHVCVCCLCDDSPRQLVRSTAWIQLTYFSWARCQCIPKDPL